MPPESLLRLSGGILCALCFGAHDRRFTRSRSGSGSQAKPSSAEEQAARRAGRHPRTLRGCLPSSHRPRRNCARRCRRRIRAADSGPSYPFHRCCGCGLPRLFSLPPGLALFNGPVPCYNRKKRNRVIFWNFMVPSAPPVPSWRPCSAWWKLA